MCRKVRGLRKIQQAVLKRQNAGESVKDSEKVAATLQTGEESCAHRRQKYEALIDQVQGT
jgi:hypothetical protein